MSATTAERLESVILEHWREICKPKADTERIRQLAAAAKELRAALRKERKNEN